MFEPFQKFFKIAANHYGVEKELTAAKICNDFRIILPVIFAEKEDPDNYIKPAYYKDHTLVVKVSSPAWAQEVIMRKPQIIDELNKKSGRPVIKNLRTKLF